MPHVQLLEPIPLPIPLPLWAIGHLSICQNELHALLGPPHSVDPKGTGLGIEHGWAFSIKAAGQRLLVELFLPHGADLDKVAGIAQFSADPPELHPVLSALGLERSDPRITIYDPVPVR